MDAKATMTVLSRSNDTPCNVPGVFVNAEVDSKCTFRRDDRSFEPGRRYVIVMESLIIFGGTCFRNIFTLQLVIVTETMIYALFHLCVDMFAMNTSCRRQFVDDKMYSLFDE